MIQKFQKAERIFVPTNQETNPTIRLKNFIINNFQIPDNNLERIRNFIASDNELKKIIYELPRIIQSEIKYDKLQIKFFEEFQQDEVILEVTAFCSMEFEKLLDSEDNLIHELYRTFSEKSVDKIIIFITTNP